MDGSFPGFKISVINASVRVCGNFTFSKEFSNIFNRSGKEFCAQRLYKILRDIHPDQGFCYFVLHLLSLTSCRLIGCSKFSFCSKLIFRNV